MDSAYDAAPIHAQSRALGHVPLIDINPRRDKALKEELANERKRRNAVNFQSPEEQHYHERTTVERVDGRLKDEFGGRNVRVRGHAKVMCHLMLDEAATAAGELSANTLPAARSPGGRDHRDIPAGEYPHEFYRASAV